MTRRTAAIATAVLAAIPTGTTAPAAAAPARVEPTAEHKIMVLPVDGVADAALRGRLTGEIAGRARSLDGQVATGNATFVDTALAVGCDPQAPGCSDQVMTTLGVDELVWASATRDAGALRVTVRRAIRGAPPREATTTVVAGDTASASAALAPLFAPPPAEAALAPVAPAGTSDARDGSDRTTGIALCAGGGLAIAVGAALWASYSSLQSTIDQHRTRTVADFQDLTALEDRANSRAIAGDLLVAAGVVAGGIGAYVLYRDHQRHLAVVPAAAPGGVALRIIGAFP